MTLPHDVLGDHDVNLVVASCVLLKILEDRHCRDITHVHLGPSDRINKYVCGMAQAKNYGVSYWTTPYSTQPS